MPGRPSLAEVYEQHVYDVHAFFGYNRLRREDVEDLTQATFERALRAWHRFDPRRASAKTWLMSIARNLLIDHHRRGAGREHVTLDEELEPTIEPLLGGGDLDPRLDTALGRLSQREREVIALRFGADLTGPEIAEMLHISLANVQQIASRALRRLRVELEQDGECSTIAPRARG